MAIGQAGPRIDDQRAAPGPSGTLASSAITIGSALRSRTTSAPEVCSVFAGE